MDEGSKRTQEPIKLCALRIKFVTTLSLGPSFKAIVFQKKILGLADSELAKVAIFVEESPKYLS